MGGILMIIFAVILIVLIVWLAARNGSWGMGSWSPGPRRDPLEIAKERYARGEITKEQFEEIKKNLMG